MRGSTRCGRPSRTWPGARAGDVQASCGARGSRLHRQRRHGRHRHAVSARCGQGTSSWCCPKAARASADCRHTAAGCSGDAPGRIALNLGAVDVEELRRGVTLSTPGALAVTRRIDARLSLLRGARPLRHGARVRVHHGTDEVIGRVSVAAIRESAGSEWRRIDAGERAVSIPAGADVHLASAPERPAVLTRDRIKSRPAGGPPWAAWCSIPNRRAGRAARRRRSVSDA